MHCLWLAMMKSRDYAEDSLNLKKRVIGWKECKIWKGYGVKETGVEVMEEVEGGASQIAQVGRHDHKCRGSKKISNATH